MVLRGRAIESGGAYRPLVDAFARASAPFAEEADLARVRPTLARVLPGWITDDGVLAPMADPAAVLAEALILLLEAMAADGAVLILDDLHWADDETVSVLTYLADRRRSSRSHYYSRLVPNRCFRPGWNVWALPGRFTDCRSGDSHRLRSATQSKRPSRSLRRKSSITRDRGRRPAPSAR